MGGVRSTSATAGVAAAASSGGERNTLNLSRTSQDTLEIALGTSIGDARASTRSQSTDR